MLRIETRSEGNLDARHERSLDLIVPRPKRDLRFRKCDIPHPYATRLRARSTRSTRFVPSAARITETRLILFIRKIDHPTSL
jgi:hypothetical protein